MSPDGILRCRQCGEERLVDLNIGHGVTFVICQVCCAVSRYQHGQGVLLQPAKPDDVPKAGDGPLEEPGYGWRSGGG
jgi:hypothetical protein